jgi:hypothetical protein
LELGVAAGVQEAQQPWHEAISHVAITKCRLHDSNTQMLRMACLQYTCLCRATVSSVAAG